MLLVRSYSSRTKRSSSYIYSTLISLGKELLKGICHLWEYFLYIPCSSLLSSTNERKYSEGMDNGEKLSWVHGGNQLVNRYVPKAGSSTKSYLQLVSIYVAEIIYSQYHNIGIHSAYDHLLDHLLYIICHMLMHASVRLLVWTWADAGHIGLGRRVEDHRSTCCIHFLAITIGRHIISRESKLKSSVVFWSIRRKPFQFFSMTLDGTTLFLLPLPILSLLVHLRLSWI